MFNKALLPLSEKILKDFPLSATLQQKKIEFDEELRSNMQSRKRLTVICGPCSADNPDAMTEYAFKLAEVQKRLPNLLIVARVYTTKPHSNGEGYLGMCFQRQTNAQANIAEGIVTCRKTMLNVLNAGLPVADELLFPELFPYFSDLVSYWFVGARSSEDSLHRAFASGTDVPCGVKNSTNGLLNFAVNSLHAVSRPCVFPFQGAQVQTNGNRFAHVVLRGGSDRNGFFANISSKDTALCKKLLRQNGLNDFLMADLSHANSGKIAENQLKNAELVALDANIDGVMAESYLFGGTSLDTYGVSKTDDCLDFPSTERLLQILSDGYNQRNGNRLA